jgi:hypothetical protein
MLYFFKTYDLYACLIQLKYMKAFRKSNSQNPDISTNLQTLSDGNFLVEKRGGAYVGEETYGRHTKA